MIHALRENQGWLTYCGRSIERRRGEDFKTVAGAHGFANVPRELGAKCKTCAEGIRLSSALDRWRRSIGAAGARPGPGRLALVVLPDLERLGL